MSQAEEQLATDLFVPLSCRCQMLVDILSRFYFEQSVFATPSRGRCSGRRW